LLRLADGEEPDPLFLDTLSFQGLITEVCLIQCFVLFFTIQYLLLWLPPSSISTTMMTKMRSLAASPTKTRPPRKIRQWRSFHRWSMTHKHLVSCWHLACNTNRINNSISRAVTMLKMLLLLKTYMEYTNMLWELQQLHNSQIVPPKNFVPCIMSGIFFSTNETHLHASNTRNSVRNVCIWGIFLHLKEGR
jgi:hypothetical protein